MWLIAFTKLSPSVFSILLTCERNCLSDNKIFACLQISAVRLSTSPKQDSIFQLVDSGSDLRCSSPNLTDAEVFSQKDRSCLMGAREQNLSPSLTRNFDHEISAPREFPGANGACTYASIWKHSISIADEKANDKKIEQTVSEKRGMTELYSQ